MVGGAVTLFIAAGVLVVLGISFAYDISQKVGPVLQGAWSIREAGPTRSSGSAAAGWPSSSPS